MSEQIPQTPKVGGFKGFVVNHKVWSAIIALFVVGVVAAAASPTPAATPVASAPTTQAPVATAAPTTQAPATQAPSTTEAPVPTQPPAPTYTVSQQNAINSAKDYLRFQAFSETGLVQQLSSKYGEGFPKADALFAVNHLNVNWFNEAALSAKDYLKTQSFSCSGLIGQLQSQYGEGFTHAQAVYGVNQTGLCG